MKKKLLLTLLPLALLAASCSGAVEGRPSSSSVSPASTSEKAADSNSEDGDTTGDDESETGGDGEEGDENSGQTDPIDEGYAVKVGESYYAFEEGTTDTDNQTVAQHAQAVAEAGDDVIFYNDGNVLSVWSDGTSLENNVEGLPFSEVQTSVTIKVGGTIDIYLKQYDDQTESGEYTFWITTPSDGSDDSPVVDEKYTILVDTTEVHTTHNETPLDPNFDEYFALDVEVSEGQKIQLRDNSSEGTPVWTITNLDSASVGFAVSGGELVCNSTGTYDIYLKFQYGNDQIYIGAAE